jgi:hypothetical protein
MEDNLIAALMAKPSKVTDAPLAESTAKNYVRYVTNLHKRVHPAQAMTSLAWLKTWSDVEPVLNTYAVSTQVSVLNAVCAVLRKFAAYKSLVKDYEKRMAERKTEYVEAEEKNEKQEEYWMPWEDVLKVRDALPAGGDKVLLSLYTMMPPGRAGEYATMEVNGDVNSYDPVEGVMTIRDHKTVHAKGDVGGTKVLNVPAPLKRVLNDWLDGRTDGSLLGLPSAGAVTKRLNKVFAPKKISVSALRHIYDSHHHGPAVEALKADAKAMGHSVGTAMKTYIKK